MNANSSKNHKTISEWLFEVRKSISQLDAEILLVEVLNKNVIIEKNSDDNWTIKHNFKSPLDINHNINRTYLISHGNQTLDENELLLLNCLVSLREKHVPIAYIVFHKEFYGREFYVGHGVLVPRPESEDIILLAKDICSNTKDNYKILDVGTGSGCLAATLSVEIKNSQVDAVDISKDITRFAKVNFLAYQGNKINFKESDLLSNVDESYDLIVANLPYVDKKWEWTSLDIKHEPEVALYANKNGLELIYKLIDQIQQKYIGKCSRVCYVLLEADPSQHQEIIEYAKKHQLEFKKKSGFVLEFSYK